MPFGAGNIFWFSAVLAVDALPTVRPSHDAFHQRPNRCVYAVDDEPAITELYRLALEAADYAVKTFNSRAERTTICWSSSAW